MLKRILRELKNHAPFTMFGALSGILLMFLVKGISQEVSYVLFYVFHAAHVFFSAIVTASLFNIHIKKETGRGAGFLKLLLIGYGGAVLIGTLSDSIIPYVGELMLELPHHGHVHIGFIEEWWIVNPLAIAGVVIAYFAPFTKLPHSAHVLVSTWASLFHMMMAMGAVTAPAVYLGVFVFLFISVWVPCCVSDIVFPMLFVKELRGSLRGCSCQISKHHTSC
jgi:hypothetical protein